MRKLVAAVVFSFSVSLLAQTHAPTLVISTTNHQKSFHQGERIPVEFSFTGPDDGSYAMDTRSYDRSGRLTLDKFTVEPASGATDPIASYFSFNSGMGGGGGGTVDLSSKPAIRTENLNEWVRFDSIGTYTVSVTSSRVGHALKDPHTLTGNRVEISSNSIQIEIVPATPEWRKATLARILRELSVPHKEDEEMPPQRRAALADLRYLASPATVAVLAANMRDDRSGFEGATFFGLVGLPRSMTEMALAEMNRLIDDPAFPVSTTFLETMALIQMDEPPLTGNDDAAKAAYERYQIRKQAVQDAVWQSVASALPRKVDPARSLTADTLTSTMPAHPSPQSAALSGAILRASFPHLSRMAQTRLLINQWKLIDNRELLPQLRLLAVSPVKMKDAQLDGFISDSQARGIALEHWYEFEPEAAMHEIMRQIGSSTPLLSARDIAFLLPRTFPQFEDMWAKGFAEEKGGLESEPTGSLLIQFGTGGALARVLPLISQRSSDFSCNRSEQALAYVVRFDPKSAAPFLAHRSPKRPANEGCDYPELVAIAKQIHASPVLLEAALQDIDNPDAAVVDDALGYLSRWGDKSAREPILRSYLKWSERWSTRGVEQEKKEEETSLNHYDRDQGDRFAEALLSGQGWLPDTALIRTVQQHCVGESMCSLVQRLSTQNHEVSAYSTPWGRYYSIGNLDQIPTQELFEAKLDQFPAGTTFTLNPMHTADAGQQREIEDSLPGLFAQHGMKLLLPGMPAQP